MREVVGQPLAAKAQGRQGASLLFKSLAECSGCRAPGATEVKGVIIVDLLFVAVPADAGRFQAACLPADPPLPG